MQLRDLLDDGQAEAEAAVRTTRGAVGLPEALEHVRQNVGRDADAVVAHADDDPVGVALDIDDDAPVGETELHGIGDEVPDDLLQAVGIGADDDRLRRIEREVDALRFRGGTR